MGARTNCRPCRRSERRRWGRGEGGGGRQRETGNAGDARGKASASAGDGECDASAVDSLETKEQFSWGRSG